MRARGLVTPLVPALLDAAALRLYTDAGEAVPMVSEELRRRLSPLARAARRSAALPVSPASPGPLSPADLGECFPESSVSRNECGEVFICQASLRQIHSGAQQLTACYRAAFLPGASEVDAGALTPYLEPLHSADDQTAALIDTETAGLHGRPLFLIGLARCRGDDMVLTQYFARSYAEERALLSQLASVLGELTLLISFNGKAFDWPFVRDRMVYHRLCCEPSFAHLDLLHPSRRRWRSHLPNCKLRTLEQYLSGRYRSDDIPGDEIPQRYHDFVRTQDARLIAPIFHHNRMDLIAMMELLVALVEDGGRRGSSSQASVRRVRGKPGE